MATASREPRNDYYHTYIHNNRTAPRLGIDARRDPDSAISLLTGRSRRQGRGTPPSRRPVGAVDYVVNEDAASDIFHTITACAAPCSLSTGIPSPLADALVPFASGELGFAPPGECAAANTASWLTPITLKPGTYNFFCRVHPFMRGVFRETKLAQPSG